MIKTAKSSYASILRSSYLVGGAQIVVILAGLVKMKVAAVLLGPAGVGLVGLYMNLVQASSTLSAMGMGHAGTRQIADAHARGDTAAIEHSRQTLYLATAGLALIGGGVFWWCRGLIAHYILDDASFADQVGWLSIGVALTVAAAGQNALLTGKRRVGDLARVSIGTGVLGTIVSVLALWLLGDQAILTMVIIIPALAFVLGLFYAARLERPSNVTRTSWMQMVAEWRAMRQLGLAFMGAGLATLIGQLAVRALVQRELGLEASGQFQAAWSIGLTYMGLVLGVMSSDFHPRLTATIRDKAASTQLVNEQTDVAVLLCAPVLLLLLGLAPWVIRLLYSAEFAPAVDVLRWQLLGDVLKVVSFPLGFVLLASGAGKTYLLLEVIGMTVFVLAVWVGLPLIGLKATGVGFLLMYVVYLPLVWRLSKKLIAFRWLPSLRLQTLALLASAVCIVLLSNHSELAATILSIALAGIAALWAFVRLKGHLALGRKDK